MSARRTSDSSRTPTSTGLTWLDAALESLAPSLAAPDLLVQAAKAEAPSMQIAILRAAVLRLPEVRAPQKHDGPFVRRIALLALTLALYRAKLPFDEADLIELLTTVRHGCGHDDDLALPLESAIVHSRKAGLSDALAEAVRVYMASLKGVPTGKAWTARRKATFLLLLSTDEAEPTRRKGSPWSTRLRASIDALPHSEQRAVRSAVLHMALNDLPSLPDAWARRATALIRQVSPGPLLAWLESCWPGADGAQLVLLDTGSSHALKNFIWLLEVLADSAPPHRGRADALVARLTELELEPAQLAEKVAVGAALYLAKRPPDVALDALRRLHAWGAVQKRPGPKVALIARALDALAATVH